MTISSIRVPSSNRHSSTPGGSGGGRANSGGQQLNLSFQSNHSRESSGAQSATGSGHGSRNATMMIQHDASHSFMSARSGRGSGSARVAQEPDFEMVPEKKEQLNLTMDMSMFPYYNFGA